MDGKIYKYYKNMKNNEDYILSTSAKQFGSKIIWL